MKNKRRFPRFGIASLAEISIPETGEIIEALVNSISRGGIGIYSPVPLDIGRELNIKISFLQTNGNEEVTEIIPGRVVWVKEFYKNFVVGITFTSLDWTRHSTLLNYLESAGQGLA